MSERLFSTTGNIFEAKRSRLLPDRGEQIAFLNYNMPSFQGGYWVRRMRQLPRVPPLKIRHIVSFCCICFFLEIIMKLGGKVGNRRSIRSKNLLFFLEITMILGENSKKRDQIEVKNFFLEITMILREKRKIRDQSPLFYREHQVLEILASGL